MTRAYRTVNLDALLDWLDKYQAEHGYAASIREVQVAFGLSSTSVADYALHRLEKKDLIRRVPGVARSIVTARKGATH